MKRVGVFAFQKLKWTVRNMKRFLKRDIFVYSRICLYLCNALVKMSARIYLEKVNILLKYQLTFKPCQLNRKQKSLSTR